MILKLQSMLLNSSIISISASYSWSLSSRSRSSVSIHIFSSFSPFFFVLYSGDMGYFGNLGDKSL